MTGDLFPHQYGKQTHKQTPTRMPTSSRLTTAQLKGTTVNLTIVAAYAPTLDAAEGGALYVDLRDAVDRFPTVDMLIDWNARPSPVETATRHILGKFTVGTRCANFASTNHPSTRFQHTQHAGKSTSTSFSIMQHPRTPHFHHRIPPWRKPTLVKLTSPLWRRYALPSHIYAITEPLERIEYQRRFTRRALTPWVHGCIG